MNKTNPFRIAISFAVVACAGGCTTLPPALTGHNPNSANVYAPDQAQRMERVQLGTVIAMRSVLIDASEASKAAGSGIGGVVGALLGQEVGDGRGRKIATAAGAVAGLIGGNKIAAHAYKQLGVTLTVRLDDGDVVAVTQAADVAMTVGQRVQVTGSGYGNSVSRVSPLDQG